MNRPHSQDPGCAGKQVLFLGLFDVSRSRREMGAWVSGLVYPGYGHSEVNTEVNLRSILVIFRCKLSKTGPKLSKLVKQVLNSEKYDRFWTSHMPHTFSLI